MFGEVERESSTATYKYGLKDSEFTDVAMTEEAQGPGNDIVADRSLVAKPCTI
jgi:hypothetical protein